MDSLEEICLFHVMKTLEQFTTDQLALLPVKFRNRLLFDLPLVDVCQLEDSAQFTAGLDMEFVWEERLREHADQYGYLYSEDSSPPDSETPTCMSAKYHLFRLLSYTILQCERPHGYLDLTTAPEDSPFITEGPVGAHHVDLVNNLVTIRRPKRAGSKSKDNVSSEIDEEDYEVLGLDEVTRFMGVVPPGEVYHKACRARQFVPLRYKSLFPEDSCYLPNSTALELVHNQCHFHFKEVKIRVACIKLLLRYMEQERQSLDFFTEFFTDLESLTVLDKERDVFFKLLTLIFDHPAPKLVSLSIHDMNASLLEPLSSILASYSELKRLDLRWGSNPFLPDLHKMIPVTECQSSFQSLSMLSIMVVEPTSLFFSWLQVCLKIPSFQCLHLDFCVVSIEVLHNILMIFFTTPSSQEQMLKLSLEGHQNIAHIAPACPSSDSPVSQLNFSKACTPWQKSIEFSNFKVESFFVKALNALQVLKLKKLSLLNCSTSFFAQIILQLGFEVEEVNVMYTSLLGVSLSECRRVLEKKALKVFSFSDSDVTISEPSVLLEAAELQDFKFEKFHLDHTTYYTLTRN